MRIEPDLKRRLLIVNNNTDEAKDLHSKLLLHGYESTWTSDEKEVLETVQTNPPDLIIIRILPPDTSGYELCRAIKNNRDTMFIPVVLIAYISAIEDKLKGIEAGADDMLIYPFHDIELFARLQSLLKLKQHIDELENAELVLFTLALGIEAKDPYTENHCRRLSQNSVELGRRLGISNENLKALERGGTLHDIGKIGIPDSILLKPGKLTQEEWGIMKQHPVIGERIVKPMKSMKLVLPIIRHHHERWDGSGYPDHLIKDEIPLTARILQLTDIYDALRTARPYKRAFSKELSLSILKEETQKGWYDPALVAEFTKMKEAEESDYLINEGVIKTQQVTVSNF